MVPSPHEQDLSDSTSNSKNPSANFTEKMSSPLIVSCVFSSFI